MTVPIDYAAFRVQLELWLRAVRRGEVQADTETIALAERAVDIGTQDLLHEAAAAVGHPAASPAVEESASAPAADSGVADPSAPPADPAATDPETAAP